MLHDIIWLAPLQQAACLKPTMSSIHDWFQTPGG